jgi:hypothetical protein
MENQMIAKLLNPMHVLMLKNAAAIKPLAEKIKAIDDATALIKKQNPEKFFHYTKDGKPDPAMRDRVFHDEPRNLELFEYAGCKKPYIGIGQADMYRARNKVLLTNYKKIKGER